MWYAGSQGHYGYTLDGGENWQIDSLHHPDVEQMEFRSLAVIDRTIFLLNVGSPAFLFKSENLGKEWKVVYEERDSAAFYDAMVFWNKSEGIAMGDPTDGCLSIIVTRNGGNTWNKIPCEQLPPVHEGEAAFAASNTNIAIHENHTWIVTGGKKARVFYSPDKGVNWKVMDTPINQGGRMTGIFSTAFWDKDHGIIWGGDWEDQGNMYKNKALTKDGGKSWQLIADGKSPGYRSCVQYRPNAWGKEVISVGIPGISYSVDGGVGWEQLSDAPYYTARFSPSGNVVWLAGKNKIGKMQLK